MTLPIRAIRTTVVSVPVAHRIVSAVRGTDRVINVLVEVSTDGGPTGLSYVAGFTPARAAATRLLIDELAEVLRGRDAAAIGARFDDMWSTMTLAGHTGVAMFAISAVDIALWDLQGKALGAPLHRLLGSRRRCLPAYASDGCWLRETPAAVAAEAEAFAAEGFRAVKVRLGRPEAACDLAALAAVRRAVGAGVAVMVDANQAWTREQAARLAPRLAEHDVAWLEEPLAAEDVAGLAALRRAVAVPITSGENSYGPDGIRALIEAGAVDTVMPDLQRVGGVTGWIRANGLAEASRVAITSHLFPEVSVHLLAASAVAGPLELVSWLAPLVRAPLRQRDGQVEVPMAPGLGFELDGAAVEHFRIEV